MQDDEVRDHALVEILDEVSAMLGPATGMVPTLDHPRERVARIGEVTEPDVAAELERSGDAGLHAHKARYREAGGLPTARLPFWDRSSLVTPFMHPSLPAEAGGKGAEERATDPLAASARPSAPPPDRKVQGKVPGSSGVGTPSAVPARRRTSVSPSLARRRAHVAPQPGLARAPSVTVQGLRHLAWIMPRPFGGMRHFPERLRWLAGGIARRLPMRLETRVAVGLLVAFLTGVVLAATVLAPPRTMDLTIYSSPSGADIFVDGDEQGFRTPATIRGLAPDQPHQVLVSAAGFEPVARQVRVPKGTRALVVDVSLRPARDDE